MSALRFILGAIALHVLFSAVYVRSVAPGHEAVERDRWFLERDPAVHVVVAGDSHPRLDVVGEMLPEVVNIATRGEDYLKNRYRLRWLLDQGGEGIDAVVLGYDAGSFSSTRLESFRPEYVWGRYVPFLELGLELGRPRAYFGKWVKAHVAPYAGEAETLAQWVGRRRSFRGKEDANRLVPIQFQWGERAAERHFPPGTAWHPMMESSLRGLIDELRARQIRVVLVSFPVTAEYAQAVEALGANEDRRDALLAELVEPGAVDHLDYESLGWGNRKLFGDADHLAPIGAKLFTLRLGRDLEELGVIAHAPRGGVRP